MGLLDNQNENQYYTNSSNYGDYQFTSLDNIINAFMITYVGESKIISKVNRTDVQFHAMRAIQELSYDVFRSIKSQEIEIPSNLTMILPQDYVNYVKLVRVDSNGIERVLYPTGKTSNPFAIEQDANGVYQYTDTDYSGSLDTISEQTPSNTWSNYKNQTISPDPYSDDTTDIEIDSRGRRYGLDPQHSQVNGSFYIDYKRGYIHFSSALAGKIIILKYISDGLGTDAEMVVHKFAEEAVYKHIAYGILSSRTNIPEYIVARFKKERFAETRKAKIRLSNIKMEEFTQVLKGMGKQIK
jgi:virulence-associated protein VagC